MPRYRVMIQASAERGLDSIPARVFSRVSTKILALADDPYPLGSKKLSGTAGDLYRIRVGDYRIIYQVRGDALVVLVVTVGLRRDVYRGLSRQITEPARRVGKVDCPAEDLARLAGFEPAAYGLEVRCSIH